MYRADIASARHSAGLNLYDDFAHLAVRFHVPMRLDDLVEFEHLA
jgi:hypothetical protein